MSASEQQRDRLAGAGTPNRAPESQLGDPRGADANNNNTKRASAATTTTSSTSAGSSSSSTGHTKRQQHQHHVHMMEQRNQRKLNSNNFLVRLISSLDLRFTDPKVESHYHIYYAQVKRNLLPTAIQVVLLVNLLQFLATCLNYYLLVDGRHHHLGGSGPVGVAGPGSGPATMTSGALEQLARSLVWPIGLQLAVFVATFAMLKVVRAELDPSRAKEANRQADAPAGRLRHASHSSSSPTGSGSESGAGSGSESDPASGSECDRDQGPAADERVSLKQGRHRRRANPSTWATKYTAKRPDGRHPSGASGLSASLSLAIEMAAAGSRSSDSSPASSAGSDHDDHHHNHHHHHDQLESTKVARRTRRRRGRTKRSGAHLGGARRRLSSSQQAGTKLTRCKLSLPYVLWLCQLVQLASGLWPQQSFIAYSTLLLYSYAIYVIFPIRLHSCVLLAAGLSLVEPLFDYLLLLNLRSSLATTLGQRTTNGPTGQPPPPPTGPPTSDLLNGAHEHALNGTILSSVAGSLATSAPTSHQQGSPTTTSAALDALFDHALAIPMTSQFQKVSRVSLYL